MSKLKNHFSRLQIWLHWTIALLIVIQLIFHEGMENAYKAVLDGKEFSNFDAGIHVVPGLLVLVLTLVRFVVRLRHGVPAPVDNANPTLNILAEFVHRFFYVMLLAVPLSGMATWGGGIREAAFWHWVFLVVLLATIAIHVAGALFHHFIKKDGLITRMMKSRS